MEKKVKKVYIVDWSLKGEYNNVYHKEFEWHTDASTCADIILETFGIENLQLLQVREKFSQFEEDDE